MTVEDIIDELGGNVEVGSRLRINTSTICMWKNKGWVPLKYWEKLIRLSKNEISAEDLYYAYKKSQRG